MAGNESTACFPTESPYIVAADTGNEKLLEPNAIIDAGYPLFQFERTG
jgi:hypothetical protein